MHDNFSKKFMPVTYFTMYCQGPVLLPHCEWTMNCDLILQNGTHYDIILAHTVLDHKAL